MAILSESDVSQMANGEEFDDEEEPGEVIESAPPLKVGEERVINDSGLKKKLLNRGVGWETPNFGDEVAVHYVRTLLDGSKFDSTRDNEQPFTCKLGQDQVANGLDMGIITMKKGEVALFTLPYHAFGKGGSERVPSNSVVQIEVELISWIMVVDVCKDGGIIKRIMEKGQSDNQPSELDEVLVKCQIMLSNGAIVAETPEEGVEFYIKDGYLLPALAKAIKTMKVGEKVNLIVQPQYGFDALEKDADAVLSSIPPDSSLNINLELVSLKRVVDVCGDSMVIKKILSEGESLVAAGEGAAVTVRYIAKLEDGTIFEKKGFDGEAPLKFITDEEQVIPGLDRAVATMKKGERAFLTIRPEYGFGEVEVQKDYALIPRTSTLVYEIDLLDFIKEKAPWELESEDRIRTAGKMKEEGNVLFKCGKHQLAGKKYVKASDYVSEDGLFGDEQLNHVKALRVQCWLNKAACSLKMEDYKEAIKLCSKVLDIESQNVKALYRRAQAFIENADLDLAESDIKKALEIDPGNREFKLIKKTLTQRKAESKERDAKLYANMFSEPASKKLKVEVKTDLGPVTAPADSAALDEKIVRPS